MDYKEKSARCFIMIVVSSESSAEDRKQHFQVKVVLALIDIAIMPTKSSHLCKKYIWQNFLSELNIWQLSGAMKPSHYIWRIFQKPSTLNNHSHNLFWEARIINKQTSMEKKNQLNNHYIHQQCFI